MKIFITAGLTVLISKTAKLCDELGELIAALPLTTLFVITWTDFDGVSEAKIANHLTHTLFLLAPTIPMFILFPWLVASFRFYVAFGGSILITILCLYVFNVFYELIGFRVLL